MLRALSQVPLDSQAPFSTDCISRALGGGGCSHPPLSAVKEALGKAGNSRASLSARLFRLSGRLAFIVAVVFLSREVSSCFPIVHISVAVLLLVYFFISQVWASW